jgi:hypothetical protein
MIPMLTTSLHLEIARLRRENERLREQRDELVRQSVEGPRAASDLGKQPARTRLFMDKADWDEAGVAPDGNRVFPSVAALKQHTGQELIGMVEVELRLVRVIEPGMLS